MDMLGRRACFHVVTSMILYQRHPKPPYSYLALIAMVILNSPEKRQTLSQVLRTISLLSPFCSGDYKGWRDSVRHNLSANACFVKVLKDPNDPRRKGNSWMVDMSRIPPKALKRQNTAASGGGTGTWASSSSGISAPAPRRWLLLPGPPALRVLRARRGASGRPRPAAPPSRTPSPESTGDRAQPPWELPTSHAQYAPPNAVAPPSTGYPLPRPSSLLPPGPGLRAPLVTGARVPSAQAPAVPVPQAAPRPRDLDTLLRVVPPNKSVFDALIPHQSLRPIQYRTQGPRSGSLPLALPLTDRL
ncbi:LOW QUALITY PROTEIN: forkhead box protein H1-like [Heptranchias perlo]|uniref:LOW QUALITY PROTEIN: forkhead box protein H1-like n=1 Tax=Heptranchias perlo TaxID=212740 RepID=UPI00355A115C